MSDSITKPVIAVFCGSKNGQDPSTMEHAASIGSGLAATGFSIIYGGGNKGLMGAVANAMLDGGGTITGVIPKVLIEWEHQHEGLTELVITEDMHERKKIMYERCDAAIVLAGGFGTLDEMFEMLTWNQLAINDKPIFILNTAGFYSDLFQMMQVMHLKGFLYDPLEKRVKIFDVPDNLMDYIHSR